MDILALERTLTVADHARLAPWVRGGAPAGFDTAALETLIDSARLVAACDIPPDVVTMNSQVVLAWPAGRHKQLTLCYPEDAEPSVGLVSVLSPVGSSLLGLRVGEWARWCTPLGEHCSAEVIDIPFQPEAHGNYTM
jgi:regulator of nucleoside diphosphate kinase